jgi:hypothetical protein
MAAGGSLKGRLTISHKKNRYALILRIFWREVSELSASVLKAGTWF